MVLFSPSFAKLLIWLVITTNVSTYHNHKANNLINLSLSIKIVKLKNNRYLPTAFTLKVFFLLRSGRTCLPRRLKSQEILTEIVYYLSFKNV
jgi:hypothetical protein